jgi:hypothetical protein
MSQPPQDMKAFNRQLIEAFRASGGRGELGPVTFEKMVVLTTVGRRSAPSTRSRWARRATTPRGAGSSWRRTRPITRSRPGVRSR